MAVEVTATNGQILIAGEVSSLAKVNYRSIAENVIRQVGCTTRDLGLNSEKNKPEILVRIHEQSPDISRAVGWTLDNVRGDPLDAIGAGDQGIMVGYATDETKENMPLPVVLSHSVCKYVDWLARDKQWIGADGKAQVTVAYDGNEPLYVDTIVLSFQHQAHIAPADVQALGIMAVWRTIPANLIRNDTKILINPSGKFTLGGPAADTGLTGRKLAVDLYGPIAHIGGGALSGRTPPRRTEAARMPRAGRQRPSSGQTLRSAARCRLHMPSGSPSR